MAVVLDEVIDAFRRSGHFDLIALLAQAEERVHRVEHLGGVADDEQDLVHGSASRWNDRRSVAADSINLLLEARPVGLADKSVLVELFGVPRHRAGRASLRVEAASLAAIIGDVIAACPALGELLDDSLGPRGCLVSLNGERFLSDPTEHVPPGSRIVILGADAGG